MSFEGPYSAFLLIDQSGSITDTDPMDARIDAAKVFLSKLDSADNVRLAAFADNGSLPFSPITLYGNSFTNDGASFFGSLDELSILEAGGTPLYD